MYAATWRALELNLSLALPHGRSAVSLGNAAYGLAVKPFSAYGGFRV